METYDWSSALDALPSDHRLDMPFATLIAEAKQAARFVRRYRVADPASGLPGLDSVKLTTAIADEIDSLVTEAVGAQLAHHATVAPKVAPERLTRARFIVDEIHAVVTYHLDDGVDDDDDQRLANVEAAHRGEPDSPAFLALELEEYVGLAARFEKDIAGLAGFDLALLAEGMALADELRRSPPSSMAAGASAALALRNRLLQLLDARVRRVRKAAALVFRAHPQTALQVASAYRRKRRRR